jgi:hypothetical protein
VRETRTRIAVRRAEEEVRGRTVTREAKIKITRKRIKCVTAWRTKGVTGTFRKKMTREEAGRGKRVTDSYRPVSHVNVKKRRTNNE